MTLETSVELKIRFSTLFERYSQQLYPGTSLEATEKLNHFNITRRQSEPNTTPREGKLPFVNDRECCVCHTKQTSEWKLGEKPNTFVCNVCGIKSLKRNKKSITTTN